MIIHIYENTLINTLRLEVNKWETQCYCELPRPDIKSPIGGRGCQKTSEPCTAHQVPDPQYFPQNGGFHRPKYSLLISPNIFLFYISSNKIILQKSRTFCDTPCIAFFLVNIFKHTSQKVCKGKWQENKVVGIPYVSFAFRAVWDRRLYCFFWYKTTTVTSLVVTTLLTSQDSCSTLFFSQLTTYLLHTLLYLIHLVHFQMTHLDR